jgi:ankyrin repeat protein
VNEKDEHGRTPLHYCTMRSAHRSMMHFQASEFAEILFENGAKVDQVDSEGLTELFVAVQNEEIGMTKLLVR